MSVLPPTARALATLPLPIYMSEVGKTSPWHRLFIQAQGQREHPRHLCGPVGIQQADLPIVTVDEAFLVNRELQSLNMLFKKKLTTFE